MATAPIQMGLAASAIPLLIRQTRRALLRRGRETARIVEKKENDSFYEGDKNPKFYSLNKFGFALTLFAAVSVFPLIMSVKGLPHWISELRGANEESSREAVFYYHPCSGILIDAVSNIPGVMSVPLRDVTHSAQFGQQLSPVYHVIPGDYLYHALFLERPRDNTFVLFDRVPDERPGYLKVTLRLLEHQGEAFLFKAETISRFERP